MNLKLLILLALASVAVGGEAQGATSPAVRLMPLVEDGVVMVMAARGNRVVTAARPASTFARLTNARSWIRSYDAETGAMQWSVPIPFEVKHDARLAILAEQVLVTQGDRAIALAKADGAVRADHRFADKVLGLSAEGLVVLATLTGLACQDWGQAAVKVTPALPAPADWAVVAPDGTIWAGWERARKRFAVRVWREAGGAWVRGPDTVLAEGHQAAFFTFPWPLRRGWALGVAGYGADYKARSRRWIFSTTAAGESDLTLEKPYGRMALSDVKVQSGCGETLLTDHLGSALHQVDGVVVPIPTWMEALRSTAVIEDPPRQPERLALWRSGLEIRRRRDGALLASSQTAQAPSVEALARSGDGRWLAASTTAAVQFWDLALLRLDQTVERAPYRPVRRTPNPDLVTWTVQDDKVLFREVVWSFAAKAPLPWVTAQEGQHGSSRPIAFSTDGKLLAQAVADGVAIHRVPSGDIQCRVQVPRLGSIAPGRWGDRGVSVTESAFSVDGSRIAVLQYGYAMMDHPSGTSDPSTKQTSITVADCADGRILAQVHRTDHGSGEHLALRDGQWVVDAGNGTAFAFGPLLELLGKVERVAPIPVEDALAGATTGPWYAKTSLRLGAAGGIAVVDGKDQVQLLASGETWAAWDDTGHFDGSRDAARLLSAWVDGRRVGLDEIAVQANRPDRLLDRLSNDDLALQQVAERTAARRGAALTARRPALSIASPNATATGVRLVATAAEAELAAWAVWVDGAPWSGALPIPTGTSAELALPTGLPAGQHVLEAAVRDAAGRWSLRARVDQAGHAAPRPRLHAACLGVSRHRDQSLDLRYAAKDALDVALALGDCPLGAEPPSVLAWTDAQVDAAAFTAARAHLAAADADDVAVVYLAGHGLYLSSAPQSPPQYRFLPHGADLTDLTGTTIPWTAIAAVFADCKASQRLLILDTCESGSADDATGPGIAGLRVASARGMRSLTAAHEQPGLAADFRRSDRSRFVTAELGSSAGAVVLSSSRGGEPSFESDEDGNGLFTQELLNALHGGGDLDRDGAITTDELVRRLTATVGERSSGRQRPTIDRDNPLARIRLPVIPKAD